MTDEVLATIEPSRARRVMAAGMLAVLGVVLIYLGLAGEGVGPGLSIVFVLAGTASIVLCQHVWRATAVTLILSEARLADSSGRVLCLTGDIAAVERSPFSFKPSNGFAVKLVAPAERAWVPGLWWRFGRRLGVGGVMSKQETKAMADTMALRLKYSEMQAVEQDDPDR